MIALWYGILAFMLTTYIVLDGRWHPSLGRHAQSSRTTAGDRSHWAPLVMARSLVSWADGEQRQTS
jgi:hypothetical protein